MKLINEPIMEEKLFYTIVISISRWYFYSPVSNFFSVRVDQLTNRISILENVFIIQSWACQIHSQWAKKFRKVEVKKLVKSNKSISRIIFWPNSIFCNFKNGRRSIFEMGKLPKMQLHEKIFFWFIWSHKFF